jgi:hypothetical protein
MHQIPSPFARWEIQKEKLKTMFPHLKNDDFKFGEPQKEKMMIRLQDKLGKTREELDKLLEQLGQF